jgi:starvation-inducible DNA-binding protein
LSPNASSAICDALMQAVAETSVAQIKAQNYHWNVKGMAFGPLHDLFGKIYVEHFAAVDELAERVRALGGHADGRYSEFVRRSGLKEASAQRPSDRAMLAELRDDQRHLSATLRGVADTAEEHGDMITNDMAITRAEAHDKFAWMLGAHLED